MEEGQAGPQVRPDVRQTCLRPLVRRGGHGGGRVLRGQGGSRCSGEGLRGGRHRLPGGRGGRRRRGILKRFCSWIFGWTFQNLKRKIIGLFSFCFCFSFSFSEINSNW